VALRRILDVELKCPCCGKVARVGDCEPDCDGEGSLGCPEPDCGGVMREMEAKETK
jgi:hypothetical protein